MDRVSLEGKRAKRRNQRNFLKEEIITGKKKNAAAES